MGSLNVAAMKNSSGPGRWLRGLGLALMALSLASCGFNSVPTAQEQVKAKWANVQAQYQRRANLIGNLVAVVKRAAKQEQDTLVKVTEARSRATSIQVSADDLSDPAKVAAFSQAQGALAQSLGRLIATAEAYPELKSNQNFLELQSQIEGTENRIAVAITDYNDAVRDYNTRIRTFPEMIGASIRGAKEMTPYQATSPGAENAPDVTAMMKD